MRIRSAWRCCAWCRRACGPPPTSCSRRATSSGTRSGRGASLTELAGGILVGDQHVRTQPGGPELHLMGLAVRAVLHVARREERQNLRPDLLEELALRRPDRTAG